jgi:signal peptidase II
VAPYLLLLLVFAADRLSKQWAAAYLATHGTTDLHPLLTITESYNRGLAFGFFQGLGPLMGWLTLLIVAALLVSLLRTPRSMGLTRSALALIIGGALGNMVDRIAAGQVLDFLTTPLLPSIFNLADVALNLGILLLLLATLRQKRSPHAGAADEPAPHQLS